MVANVVSLALATLALACSAFLWTKIIDLRPSELAKQALKQASGLESKWNAEVALFTAQREAWMIEFASIADRCDETLDRAESKRRRVAATESRAQATAAPAEMTREQIIDAARRRTLGVQ